MEVSMTGKAKKTLDSLVKKITGEKMVEFMTQRITLFTDGADIPCRRWSELNQFITFMIGGTCDARGIRQWAKAGRKVKKGAKAFYIYVPMIISTPKATDPEDETANAVTNAVETGIDKDKKALVGFRLMPVFRVEDTEGAALDYEIKAKQLKVKDLPLIEVAKSLGVHVKTGLTKSKSAAGTYANGLKTITMNTENKQVFLHELSHAIDFALPNRKADYAFGEVVAELSSAFLGSLYGVPVDLVETRDYIGYWAKKTGEHHPGHVAFKVTQALSRVEEIYRFIETKRKKTRSKAKKQPVLVSGNKPKTRQVKPIVMENEVAARVIPDHDGWDYPPAA
jgi:antirestriction protein ArdC